MITPELISYIRGEFTKGRLREQIHETLVKEGGWSEADLSEAFQTAIPVYGTTQNSSLKKSESSPGLSPPPSSFHFSLRKILLIFAIFAVVGGIGFIVWFYNGSLMNLWNQGISQIKGFSASLFGSKIVANTEDASVTTPQIAPRTNAVPENAVSVEDCGIGNAPDLKKSSTYQNNAVLACLGNNALNCTPAKAVLKNALFPTLVQIVKNQESCVFKLSYAEDSALIDATGKKLAGQYVSCPLSVVKAVDESKKVPAFNPPNVDNLNKYGSQIYFYGTLGLFMESSLDRSKIQALGCSGPYIDSVIASFQKMQNKK